MSGGGESAGPLAGPGPPGSCRARGSESESAWQAARLAAGRPATTSPGEPESLLILQSLLICFRFAVTSASCQHSVLGRSSHVHSINSLHQAASPFGQAEQLCPSSTK